MEPITVMRVYLDTMIWIYALEGHPTFGSQAQRILKQIHAAKHTLLTSNFLLAEMLVAPVKRRDAFTVASYKQRLTGAAVEVVPFSVDVAMAFASIRAQHRTHPADSLHLALASVAQADVFVTGDTDLTKLSVSGIKRIADTSISF